jgi:hypothetical protein
MPGEPMPDRNFSRKPCPENSVFERVFLGETDHRETERFLDHIFDCRVCKAKFEILKDIDREIHENESGWMKLAEESLEELKAADIRPLPALRSGGRAAPIRRRAAVLSAAVFIAAGYYLIFSPLKSAVPQSERKSHLRLLEPGGLLKKPPTVFKWTQVKNAGSYVLSLIDNDLRTIAQSNIKARVRYEASPQLQEKLQRGKIYIWSIEAYDDDGIKIGSAQRSFEIE